MQKQFISYDPSAPVKLVGEEEHAPRHLEDDKEQALVAAITNEGTLRNRVLIILLLHTGLRAREICQLRQDQVKLGKRSGTLEVIGKRNKYHEVPLNATARKALEEYLSTLPCSPLGKLKKLFQNVRLVISSKSMRRRRSSPMLVLMTCATVLGIAWQSLSRSIDLPKLWGTTHWIPLDSIFKEQSMICSRLSKP